MTAFWPLLLPLEVLYHMLPLESVHLLVISLGPYEICSKIVHQSENLVSVGIDDLLLRIAVAGRELSAVALVYPCSVEFLIWLWRVLGRTAACCQQGEQNCQPIPRQNDGWPSLTSP